MTSQGDISSQHSGKDLSVWGVRCAVSEIFVWGEGGNEYLVEGEEMRNIFVWEKYWELLL